MVPERNEILDNPLTAKREEKDQKECYDRKPTEKGRKRVSDDQYEDASAKPRKKKEMGKAQRAGS